MKNRFVSQVANVVPKLMQPFLPLIHLQLLGSESDNKKAIREQVRQNLYKLKRLSDVNFDFISDTHSASHPEVIYARIMEDMRG